MVFPVQASVLCLPRQVDGKVSQSAALCLALGSPVAGSRISPVIPPFPSILASEDADRLCLTQLHSVRIPLPDPPRYFEWSLGHLHCPMTVLTAVKIVAAWHLGNV